MCQEFILGEISDIKLSNILAMNEEEKLKYFRHLVSLYYPHVAPEDDYYERLIEAYKASFLIEKIYRTNYVFQSGFSTIYTKTGLIRNIVSDLFHIDEDLTDH